MSEADLVIITAGDNDDSPQLSWRVLPGPDQTWRAAALPSGSWLRLRFSVSDDWVEFTVDPGGTRLSASLSSGALWKDASEMLLGRVFSGVLVQRGRTCLHAAVVQVGGRSVGLIGASGSGKSTTALALVRRGAVLVSDDVAVLTELGGRPAVPAGPPRLRVRADAAKLVTDSWNTLQPLWTNEGSHLTKRYVDLSGTAPPRPDDLFPLDALYFLTPRHSEVRRPSIQPMSAAEAVPRLMASRHMAHLIERDGHRRDFDVLAGVAESVRIGELHQPNGLDSIDRTVDAILGDVGRAA